MAALTINAQSVEDQKLAFAAALLKNPDKPFEVASAVISDTGQALYAATYWIHDPIVKQYQIDLLEKYGADKFLPTEVDQLRDIYKIATCEANDKEIRLRAHELYAKIKQRYFSKPDVMNTQLNLINQGVMQVVNNGTDEEWETKAIEQQQKLIRDANIQ
jgi:hypothetical protein